MNSTELAILLLRLALVGVLYAFLLAVLRAARRTLDAASLQVRADVGAAGPQRAAAGVRGEPGGVLRLAVLDAGDTSLPVDAALEVAGGATVGRAQTCSLTLADGTVSSEHARLERVDGVWLVRDLGSTNGTLVNGQPADGPTRLAAGDEIAFGRVRLRVAGL